jgi:hypothetical protein
MILNEGQRLGALLVLTVGLASCGANQPESTALDEAQPGEQESALVVPSGTSYASYCSSQHVPMPPTWVSTNVDAPPNTNSAKAWKANGHLNAADSYISSFRGANIYYSSNASGVCAIAAHEADGGGFGEFDVICQNPAGRACFWAGTLAQTASSTAVDLVASNSVTPGQGCTTCHAGENAFIGHFSGPVGLASVPGWFPSSWATPIVTSASEVQNPGPEPITGYPSSTSGCPSCHSAGGSAGRFPLLTSPQLRPPADGGAGASYCDILRVVTNRSGANGGMPPTLTCTPDVDCAAQTDPYVQAMLAACAPQTARADFRTPTALTGYGTSSPYLGQYEHVLVGTGSLSSYYPSRTELWNNYSSNGYLHGWDEQNKTNSLPTTLKTGMWLKDSIGASVSMVATDASGYVWELNGTSKYPVNSVLSAGAPSPYLRHDGYNVVVFRGFDGWIYESYWNGSSWLTNFIPSQTLKALGDPIGYSRGSSSAVVYKCDVNRICELRWMNGSWSSRTLPASAYIKGTTQPVPFKRQGVEERTIYYTSYEGLHAISDNTDPAFGPVSDTLIVADPWMSSSPAPYSDQVGGASVVYTQDQGASGTTTLMEATKPYGGASYTAYQRYSTPRTKEALIGDPAAYVSGVFRDTLYVRNSANVLYQFQATSSSATAANKQYAQTIMLPGTLVQTSGTVNQNAEQFWSFSMLPTGKYKFNLTPSSGDSDLYVKVGSTASTTNYDCRPYSSGTTAETCTAVLSSNNYVSVMVRGYTAGTESFSLSGAFTP